jgi:hypothetical protein
VKAWKTAPKNVGNLMEKARRCGVYVGLARQAVWRDDFDLTMWSGNEVLKAPIGAAIVGLIDPETPMP